MSLDVKEAQRAMSDFVNGMGHDKAEFIELMARDHRTLQQQFTGLCLAWIKHMAELKEYEYDARNEYSRAICKKLLDNPKIDPKYDFDVPMI